MSFRDVEDLLAERGVEVSNESIRCWALKFGPAIARNLRCGRPSPTPRWHLDEMVVKIAGVRMYMWRAVDDESEVLDVLVQKRRNKTAAVKFLRRTLKSTEVRPEVIITDGLYSYRSATRALGCADRHKPGDCERTIGSRTRICRSDDENGRCSASSPKVPPSVSSPPTPPSITLSPFNDISSQDLRIACFGARRSPRGTTRPLQADRAKTDATATSATKVVAPTLAEARCHWLEDCPSQTGAVRCSRPDLLQRKEPARAEEPQRNDFP